MSSKEETLDKKLQEVSLKQEVIKRKQELKRQRQQRNQSNACRLGVKSMYRSFSLWLFLTFFFLCVITLTIYAWKFHVTWKEKFGDEKLWPIVFIVYCSVFFVICLAKTISGSAIRRRIKHCGLECLKKIPDECNDAIREAYVGLHCRKCINYWISFGLGGLAFVSIIYVLLIGLGNYIAYGGFGNSGGGNTGKLLAIFKKRTFSSFTWGEFGKISSGSEDWSTKICFSSLLFLIFVFVHYYFSAGWVNRKIRVIEKTYGRERLVNDCLLCCRVNLVNRRYKLVVFSTVCFVGCVIYLIFKRLICSVFDKSFAV